MLKTINLTCGYESAFLLKDINCEIEPREFFGIIGPNGSGKTTFLRATTKIILPQKGEILLKGTNLKELSYQQIARQVAVVTQTGELTSDMTVEEFVLTGRIPHLKRLQFLETKTDWGKTKKALELTGTLFLKQRWVNSLSTGEKQLVAIARALAQEPEIILLDEPTSHLDIGHQIKILDFLRRQNKREGLTIVVVLHDLNLASQYCDRLMLLNQGQVRQIGTPSEVLTYKTIEEVYGTVVVVQKNPLSKKPYVLAISEEEISLARKRNSADIKTEGEEPPDLFSV